MSQARPQAGTRKCVRFDVRYLALACSVLFIAPEPAFCGPGPSSQVAEELKALRQADQRVTDIGWRLLAASTDLCPKHSYALGIALHNLPQYAPEVHDAARQAFAFSGTLPSVLTVAKDSPAARAGIKPDDVLLRIGGTNFAEIADPAPANPGKASYASIDRAMRLLEDLPDEGKVDLTLQRKGAELTLSLRPQVVCRSRIELAPGNSANANANGDVAQISTRLAASLANDDELAFVLAHEIAHNQLGHPEQIAKEKLMSGLLPGLGRKGKQLRDMERAADRFGTLMAARAQFNYKAAPSFWENFTQHSGLGSFWATTHPSARNRRQNLEALLLEIEQSGAAPTPQDPAPSAEAHIPTQSN